MLKGAWHWSEYRLDCHRGVAVHTLKSSRVGLCMETSLVTMLKQISISVCIYLIKAIRLVTKLGSAFSVTMKLIDRIEMSKMIFIEILCFWYIQIVFRVLYAFTVLFAACFCRRRCVWNLECGIPWSNVLKPLLVCVYNQRRPGDGDSSSPIFSFSYTTLNPVSRKLLLKCQIINCCRNVDDFLIVYNSSLTEITCLWSFIKFIQS
jgi:hypothetical protein